MPHTIILLHGYSDRGQSFRTWKNSLKEKANTNQFELKEIHTCNYKTLTNEVTIKDIAEAFDNALREVAGLDPNEPFSAIVHSTGMLVLRSWLTTYAARKNRLRTLIALAPASFGSPLAHKGRSWLGALFKANKNPFKPDFMEAGNMVLDGLELGSKFTWDLAHKDLLNVDGELFYGKESNSPYVFTFCGTEGYPSIKGQVVNSPGSDGTVRLAGCSLNTRKIEIDFTVKKDGDKSRFKLFDWNNDNRSNLNMPVILLKELNHNTILNKPNDALLDFVIKALNVKDAERYEQFVHHALETTKPTFKNITKWQQFVVHAKDERGDPVSDYNIQLYKLPKGKANINKNWEVVKLDVHAYEADKSYRCIHINLTALDLPNIEQLKMQFYASSGSSLIGYYDYIEEGKRVNPKQQYEIEIDLSAMVNGVGDDDVKFFFPFTTTLVEFKLNREPVRDVAYFI